MVDLNRLRISGETRPRREHEMEARRIVSRNRRYMNDTNYRLFVSEVVNGLCDGMDRRAIVELIRSLQRMLRTRTEEGS
jgi:hypothetical protein